VARPALPVSRFPPFSRPPNDHRGDGQDNSGNVNHGNLSPANRGASGDAPHAGNGAANLANMGHHSSHLRYGFYHGHWNGHYGAAGYGMAFAGRPMAWGMGTWGSGAAMYNCGYLGYSNPYYSSAEADGGFDYSQPILVADNTPNAAAPADAGGEEPPPADEAANSAEEQLYAAIDAFKNGDCDSALKLVNQAIEKRPADAVLHEFRALVLFATKEYEPAAATIHAVLAVGPGWDWTTLSSLYADISVYTEQFKDLELYVLSHPQDGAAHFLLAYHYLTCGHPDSAAAELEQVVKLVPADKVAADLLKMLSPPKAPAQKPTAKPPLPDVPKVAPQPIEPASLVGTWKAERDDGSKFELALKADSNFTWKYAQQQKSQEFAGTYSVEGKLLVLNRKDGASLVGQLTSGGQKKFNFKIVGGPGDDPGLDFAR
jgi:tetratricopeptide (TPR) repeat protein